MCSMMIRLKDLGPKKKQSSMIPWCDINLLFTSSWRKTDLPVMFHV